MNILTTILAGLIVGLVAKWLLPGRDPGGGLMTILVGIIGAGVGEEIGHALGGHEADGGAGFIASVLGAILLLAAYRYYQRAKGTE
jgi:uncharacterized membrane protein YeaQ/YmgE (transglycosylase-associated protein family)